MVRPQGELLVAAGVVVLLGGLAACSFNTTALATLDAGPLVGDGPVDRAPPGEAAADAGGDGPGRTDTAAEAGAEAAPADAAPPTDTGPEAAPADAAQADAAPADSTTSCTGWSYAPTNFDPCAPAIPAPQPLGIGAGLWTLDTDSGSLTQTGGGSITLATVLLPASSTDAAVRLVAASSLQVDAGATVRVTGARALILAVYGSASVAGTIDASAQIALSGYLPGPGGDDPLACAGSGGGSGANATGVGVGAGGGGGGGFGGTGGDGGDGQGGGHGPHGGKGAAGGVATIAPLRGGCPGGDGGNGLGLSGLQGGGGGGGGAIQISARDGLVIAGSLQAGGGGGFGSLGGRGGAGGGGSGGAILLEAPTVIVQANASLCANGGAGGEGADLTPGGPGQPGGCTDPPSGAATLAINANGGDGGGGAYLGHLNGANASNGSSGAGGGGGGGGVGRIRVRGTTTRTIDANAVVSPGAAS
ncbi:MAG TPA: hypothetical protein VGQ83_22360 [Polyangia bacterium]|jgi:hypothetical protein